MKRKNLLVTILFTIFGGPGTVGIYIPAWITRWHIPPDGRTWRILLGCLLIALGLIPLFESIIRFLRVGRGTLSPTHPTETLVVSGLYRYVRNPMYVGILTLLLGQIILFTSTHLAVYTACVARRSSTSSSSSTKSPPFAPVTATNTWTSAVTSPVGSHVLLPGLRNSQTQKPEPNHRQPAHTPPHPHTPPNLFHLLQFPSRAAKCDTVHRHTRAIYDPRNNGRSIPLDQMH